MNYRTIKLWLMTTIVLAFTLDCTSQEDMIYNPSETYTYAHKLFAEGQYLEADVEFAKIIVNDSLYNQALYNRVVANRLGGQIEESMLLADQVLELDKEYLAESYINKAHCLDSLDKKDLALTQLEKAIEKFPYNYDLKTARGKLLFDLGQYDKAIEIYKECILAEPLRNLHHLRLAQLMMTNGGITHAILPLTVALAVEPEGETNLNVIRQANAIVSSKSEYNNPSFNIEDYFQSFEDTDDLVGNYIALSDKYKIPGVININYIKQLHLILSETEEKKETSLQRSTSTHSNH